MIDDGGVHDVHGLDLDVFGTSPLASRIGADGEHRGGLHAACA